ncbi:unnamed protein product [Haemonchus placei]|uniref:Uncharacterized protein n=1 Tax=Haemonchus placei TaxID=6290 RepID=A0A0N4WB63_HAEPC|nr:unnamed protein product [Haemonchus placei]
MDAPHDAQPQPPQEDVSVEPGDNDEVNDTPAQLEPVAVPVIRQPEYRPLNKPRIQRDESENIELMHRKLNRILGWTDEIQSIKNRIGSILGLLHIVDQRTIEMKVILDRTIDGLEQVYTNNEQFSTNYENKPTSSKGSPPSRFAPRRHHLAPAERSGSAPSLRIL